MQQMSDDGTLENEDCCPPQAAIHTERAMRIICVGAGSSGLCFAYKLQRSFNNFSLTIYEKNHDVAGTWLENNYPGCRCDFPCVNYTYTFEPSGDFSGIYGTAVETRKYFEDFKARYGLGRYCKLRHKVNGARWIDQLAEWEVHVEDLATGKQFQDSCNILINACGYLNSWRWPDVPGLPSFKGLLLHSANWDTSVELANLNVGLIGSGISSSGIQILPAIQPIVKKLTTVIRTPTWISPPFGPDEDGCKEKEIQQAADKPGLLLHLRKEYESQINGLFRYVFADSPLQATLRAACTDDMRRKLNTPHLADRLIPQFGVGARRLTPGPNYLEALCATNVEVAFGEIETITDAGIVVDGREVELDVLICATGFDNSYKPQFPAIGLQGRNLQVEWASEARGYMSIAAAGFPNYLMFTGPNSPVANGSLLPTIECQADYMLKFCNRWQTENIATFHPKAEAVDEFCAHTDRFMKRTVWDQDNHSWFKKGSASGRNVALWPGSSLHFLEAMSEIRADDWHITYHGNRFKWLGNGFSQTETIPNGDMSYYIRNSDDSGFLGNAKRVRCMNVANAGGCSTPTLGPRP
ncbi:MAG: hypothetical protein Q9188_002130 [Gyalolechia gomerana]